MKRHRPSRLGRLVLLTISLSWPLRHRASRSTHHHEPHVPDYRLAHLHTRYPVVVSAPPVTP